ncbi:MAG: FtsH protease activity modulator HflK [Chromatiales bacterium]|jgi:membrane protease subunit HflK|nr:FtsH protease activity modulator HflK [Chromatiales bacterium]
MAWNESGNGKNPWDRGRRDGPPDLDRVLRDLQRKLSGLLRGGRGGGGFGGATGAPSGGSLPWLVIGVVVVGWLATGFYQVDDAGRGVVLRFGRYVETTLPGLRWHLPWPIERVERVNINEIVPFRQQFRMLTRDENIIEVDLSVQYRRADPVQYLFNVRDPDRTLEQVSESAIREVIGKNELDFVLTAGRSEIALQTEKLIQQTLDDYKAGLVVTKVNLQDANFPSQVQAAVQDAIKAREDKERLSFEAQKYANEIVPLARGEAVRRQNEAEGYRQRVIADAQGEASRFTQLLAEYEKAPAITRKRIYLDVLEEIYGNANKVLLDTRGSGNSNLVYLPLEKLLEQRGEQSGAAAVPPRPAVAAPPADLGGAGSARTDRRNRGER